LLRDDFDVHPRRRIDTANRRNAVARPAKSAGAHTAQDHAVQHSLRRRPRVAVRQTRRPRTHGPVSNGGRRLPAAPWVEARAGHGQLGTPRAPVVLTGLPPRHVTRAATLTPADPASNNGDPTNPPPHDHFSPGRCRGFSTSTVPSTTATSPTAWWRPRLAGRGRLIGGRRRYPTELGASWTVAGSSWVSPAHQR
jgi:hypothetical protein